MAGGAARAATGGSAGGNSNLNLEGFTGTKTGLSGAMEKLRYSQDQNQAAQDRNNIIAKRGATMGTLVPGQSSQPQANDHTHEENNNAQPGGMTGVGGGVQPGLQGLATAVTGSPQGVGAANSQPGGFFGAAATAVTGSPQGVGAANSQPQLRGGAGMAANKAAMVQAGASNVASQNQNGQDLFGGQSLPEKGAIGVAGMDQMEQF